jgi:hypothetical protein
MEAEVSPSKAERQRIADSARSADLEEAGLVGEQFELGDVDCVVRYTKQTPIGRIGQGLAVVLSLGGFFALWTPIGDSWPDPVKIGIFASIFPLWIVGFLFKDMQRDSGGRMCLYTEGMAQLLPGEPEPRVLRWADVTSVVLTCETDSDNDPKSELASCSVHGNGVRIGNGENACLVVARTAYRVLAPRLVPPMIALVEAGEEVTADAMRVSQEVLTLPDGTRHAWTSIKSISMGHATKDPASVVTSLHIAHHRGGGQAYATGVPNWIFLVDVIADLAARHGIQLTGYEQAGPAQPVLHR